MVWFERFHDPIILPDGSKLLTLWDAARYITGLSAEDQDHPEWQLAMEALMLAAETGAPSDLAHTAVLNALRQNGSESASPQREAEIIQMFLRKSQD